MYSALSYQRLFAFDCRTCEDDVRRLTDAQILETLSDLGAEDVVGLPLHDITNEDGTRMRGALTALSINKDDLMVFIVEGSGDTSIPFSERLAAWRDDRTPSGSGSSPRGLSHALENVEGTHDARGRGRGRGGRGGGGGGGRGRGRGGSGVPLVSVDHAAEWQAITRKADGTWAHSATRPRGFTGSCQPEYNSTRRTPNKSDKRKLDGSGEKLHDEKWAFNTQLNDHWFEFLRKQVVLYLNHIRNEALAARDAEKPYTKRLIETKADGTYVIMEPTKQELHKFIAISMHRGMLF